MISQPLQTAIALPEISSTFMKMSETEKTQTEKGKKNTEADKFQTPARLGWGTTAEWLHPRIAKIGTLGPLGGRLSKVPSNEEYYAKLKREKEEKDRKEMLKKRLEEEEEERDDESHYFSNLDLFLYLSVFLFSAGLILAILILPLPNMWTLNEDFVYLAAGVLSLGLIVFTGSVLTCLLRTLCCSRRGESKKDIILVSPMKINKESDVDQLMASVYSN